MKTRTMHVLIAAVGSVLIASFVKGGASAAPNPPYGLAAIPQNGSPLSVELSWIDNSTDELAFKIERSWTSGTAYVELLTVPADAQSCIDNTVGSNMTYYYRVRATNDAGNSAPSNEVGVLTYPYPPWLEAAYSTSATEINLIFFSNAYDTAEIRVEQGLSDSGPFATVATLPAGITSYLCTGLTEGVRYYFRLIRFNATGDSEPSNVVSAVPRNPAPPPHQGGMLWDLWGCSVAPWRYAEAGYLPGPVTLLMALMGFRIYRRRRASRKNAGSADKAGFGPSRHPD